MLTLAVAAVVDVPELGPLVLRVPLAELVAEGEEALLGACLLLVAPGAAHHRVELVLLDRVEQRRGLQPVARGTRAGVLDDAAPVDRVLDRRDDEPDVEPLDRRVAELDDLGEVVPGVDVHDRERQARGPERLRARRGASRRCPCRPRTAAPAARTRPPPRAAGGSTPTSSASRCEITRCMNCTG